MSNHEKPPHIQEAMTRTEHDPNAREVLRNGARSASRARADNTAVRTFLREGVLEEVAVSKTVETDPLINVLDEDGDVRLPNDISDDEKRQFAVERYVALKETLPGIPDPVSHEDVQDYRPERAPRTKEEMHQRLKKILEA